MEPASNSSDLCAWNCSPLWNGWGCFKNWKKLQKFGFPRPLLPLSERWCEAGENRKRQERKQWGLWTPSLPHLCTHSGAAGVHEQPLVSGHGDYVPQAAQLLPETGLTLGKTLTHQGWRGDESRRITAVDEPCKVSAFWSSVWKGWEGNEKSLLEKKQCKGSRWHWLSCCKNPQRSFYTICVGYFSYPVDTEEKRVIIYVSIYFCTSGH